MAKGHINLIETAAERIAALCLMDRRAVKVLVDAAADLGLPHPAHILCSNLGLSGNVETTLEPMRAFEGRRAHFAHVQFHSYGGKPGPRR